MKTFTIAFAVATTAALCSAQSIKPGAKFTIRELAAQTPAAVNLPGVPLVGGSDNCATPDAIFGTGNFAFDNTTATSSSPAIPATCGTPNTDVWFTWVSPSNGTATLALCGHTTSDTIVAIYNGSTCPGVTSIACNDDSCGVASSVSWVVGAGNQYMLRIGMFSSTPGVAASFDLTIAGTPPPANDNCATPTVISGVGNFAANMASATSSMISPSCQFGLNPDADVWYDWTAPATGTATMSLCAHTTADTVIAVYPGTGCPAPASDLACDDDFCGFASASQLSLPVTSGTHYLIQVGMFSGGAGVNTSFDITMPPPINDDCSTPIVLAGPGVYPYDSTLATTGSQGQTDSACLFFSSTSVAKDLWYTYTASTNGMATFSTCGTLTSSNKDTKIAVYPGAGCPTLAAIVCKDDDGSTCASSSLSTTVTWAVTCGTQYTLQLGQYPGNLAPIFGAFTVSETGTGCLTAPTEFCFGTAGTCPCGNVGAANNGCASSTVAAGAHLTATGTNSISGDTLVLTGSGMSATGTALYFQGNTQVSVPFGDGIGCAGGSQLRLGTKANVGGTSAYPGVGDMSVSTRGGAVAGSNLNYQIAYRDAGNFCTSSTFNASSAVNVVWAP